MNKINVQHITTPKGELMAVLPMSEYEQLIEQIEDLQDAQAAKQILARIESGEEEVFPDTMVNRLLNDENPILVYREYRKLTAKQLGEAAGVSQAYISQLEGGKRQGTVDVMAKIAKALNVTIDDLV